jgi:hypothetical protein
VVISGKDVGASKVMGDTRKSADRMGEGFDKSGEKADDAESKLIGLHDTVDGLHTIMQGPGQQGMVSYIQGFADLAGGVATFVIPALKMMTKAVMTSAIDHVKAAGTTVISWVRMATQATINAVRMAAAWVIALGPVGWAIGLLVALGAAFVILWKTSERFRDIVKGALAHVWNWLKSNWPYLLGILTGPFGLAVVWIIKHWDQVVSFFKGLPGRLKAAGSGMWNWIKETFKSALNAIIDWWNGFEFQAPTVHIPGTNLNVGGFTIGLPDLPHLAKGGVVRARPGGTLALLGEGGHDEVVTPLDGRRGGGPAVIEFRSDGTRLSALLLEVIREAVRIRGGDVQVVIGSS